MPCRTSGKVDEEAGRRWQAEAHAGVTRVTVKSGAAAQGPERAGQARHARRWDYRHDQSHLGSLDHYSAGETAAALAVVALFLPREADMTKEAFGEAVHRLAGHYADEGPGRHTKLAEIEDMAQAMCPSTEG